MSKKKKLKTFQWLQIELGNLITSKQAGDKLPSELELAKILHVSRSTLREAMRTFEAKRLIRRKQGQGTFVIRKEKVIESGLEVLESIETLAEKIGLKVTMGDLKISAIEADQNLANSMKILIGDRLTMTSRTINAERRPVAYLIDILPQDILGMHELNGTFSGSVLDWLLKRGSPDLEKSFTRVQATSASKEVARLLQIKKGDSLLMFDADLYSYVGRVIDHSMSYFLPGYFRFNIVRRVGRRNKKRINW